VPGTRVVATVDGPKELWEASGLDWLDYRPAPRRYTESQIAQGIDMIENRDHLLWHRHQFRMWEAITTTDFPYLFGTIIDRELLARYKVAESEWRAITKVGTLPNFAQHTRDRVDGLTNILPRVTEKGEYLVAPVSSEHYTRQVFKRGRQFDISWEALVNDGMGAFDDVPARFSDAAANTDAYIVSSLIASATGPNALLFAVAGITNAGVLALTIANLEATLALMAQQQTTDGLPMGIRGMHLWVPPALEMTARAVVTSALKQWTEVGAGGGIPVPTANVLVEKGLQVHVDPWLPIIDTSGNVDTTWYLFADTGQGYAIGLDHLRGHENPEICMKASNKVAVGGAPMGPFEGDFESDNVFYRVRVCPGGCYIDPRFAYAQVG
jgi:hypothetical protein